jgi:N utilization substance protein B
MMTDFPPRPPSPRPGAPRQGPGRKRSAARLAAVQALYQMELSQTAPTGAAIDAIVREFIKHRIGQEIDGDQYAEVDQTLFADIVKGASLRRNDLDGMISSALSDEWPLERLEAILRAILRAGAYELLERTDVPARVTISEYLDVAHAFFGGKEPSLVNGVLDKLARVLRPQDLGPDRGGGAG